jgi:hypothetical protein
MGFPRKKSCWSSVIKVADNDETNLLEFKIYLMWLRFHDKGPWFDFLAGFSGHFFRVSLKDLSFQGQLKIDLPKYT